MMFYSGARDVRLPQLKRCALCVRLLDIRSNAEFQFCLPLSLSLLTDGKKSHSNVH